MGNLVAKGKILFIDEVVEELGRKEDGAYEWVAARPESIIAIDGPIQDAVTNLLRDHQRWGCPGFVDRLTLSVIS